MNSQVLRRHSSTTIGALDMNTWAADIIDEAGNIYEVKYMFRREWRKDKREWDILIDINGKTVVRNGPVEISDVKEEEDLKKVAKEAAENIFTHFMALKDEWGY